MRSWYKATVHFKPVQRSVHYLLLGSPDSLNNWVESFYKRYDKHSVQITTDFMCADYQSIRGGTDRDVLVLD